MRSEAYEIATTARKYASVSSKTYLNEAIINAAMTSLNEARSARRTKQRTFEATFQSLAFRDEQVGEIKAGTIANSRGDVLSGLVRTEVFAELAALRRVVRKIVAHLPENDRKLAELIMSKLTQDAIAKRLGVTVRTVRNRRAALAPYFGVIWRKYKALRAELG